MYSNSKAKIKLTNKVSEFLEVLTGTKKGHPMSPEVLELSENLQNSKRHEITGAAFS